ncbi:hypothetical protein HNQ50_000347 [Silvimonas terrae]|uniref:Deacetylase sirtuin-type domain-containing protein n=1 Tax=Silvimonas terrae TaxID=300266 RepID=A0A840R9P8_9NEIS|nr:SIR2 family protein [Silvimonas terrae]MBB5189637.1 hypothetical protein [Silvimonas terrae]
MTLLKGDPITQLAFSVYENAGVFAVLLGSGLSRAAEIPTGWEITLDLVRRVAVAQGVEEQPDWADWYRGTIGQEPNYSTLLEELTNSPDERRAILHRYIEPDVTDRQEGRKVPTKAHHAIAQLVRSGHIRVIITTNFDRLMENALREQGIEPTVISSVDSLSGAEPLTHSRCYVLKLHGDYKDSRILNTDEELSAYSDSYNKLLDRIFDEHGLIICGWSGEWDHALRAAFLRAPNRRYSVYWAARGSLGTGAGELAAHRQAKLISIRSADDFFPLLQQRVETLENSQRQNPLSVELLVNSAKRYLAKTEHRIQLDELFAQETERLLSQLDGGAFTPNGVWSQDEFRSRVQSYESVTEPLARMTGVLGRWGDGSETRLVTDILKALYLHAGKIGSGLTVFLNLRSYPVVLVLTAYGIGLTKAGRWKALHQLFSMTMARDQREPQPIASTLFLGSWSGSDPQLWQNLEGFDRRKTPLSDHLLDVMTEWKKSFVGIDGNFELLFERFEMMGSLAHFEMNSEAALEEAARSNMPGSGLPLAWMPMGRAGWRSDGGHMLMQELQQEAFALELLAAGVAKNSRSFLELFVKNFRIIAGRMSW